MPWDRRYHHVGAIKKINSQIPVNGKERYGNVYAVGEFNTDLSTSIRVAAQAWQWLCSFQSTQMRTGISSVWPVRQVTAMYLAWCKYLLYYETTQLVYLTIQK